MGESFEERQRRLKLNREADARRRKRKADAAHKSQVEAFFGAKEFSPKQQASLEQTLQYIPPLPYNAWQVLVQQMAQAYVGMSYAQQRFVSQPLPSSNVRQTPENWDTYFRDAFRTNHVRASSAVNAFGICERKWLFELANEKTGYYQNLERPKALARGSSAHKKMENAERAVAESYVEQGYAVSYDKESLLGFQGLGFVQEAAFEAEFPIRGHNITLSGHPDRVLSGGRTKFVLEAKTNLMKFSPKMVAGAIVQDLFYGLLVEKYAGGPVVLALTESGKPLERRELDYLVQQNEAGFAHALLGSGKIGMLVPFTPDHRNLGLYFLDKMVSVLYNPRSSTGAEKQTCDRYECPFRSRGCEFYSLS